MRLRCRKISIAGERSARYGGFPVVLVFDEGARVRVQAYTLPIYAWMSDTLGSCGEMWDVESNDRTTRIYFASKDLLDTFVSVWGELLEQAPPPGLTLPVIPWPDCPAAAWIGLQPHR